MNSTEILEQTITIESQATQARYPFV